MLCAPIGQAAVGLRPSQPHRVSVSAAHPQGQHYHHRVDPADAVALARRFEPVLRYTQGELFLPLAAEAFVTGAALYRRDDRAKASALVVPAGGLDPDTLAAQAGALPGVQLELRYVIEPLDRTAYKEWRKRPGRPEFHSDSRFALVSLLGRVIDAFMRMSLLVRGKVPGGFAAAAEIRYRASGEAARPAYHVRASRDAGYLVLQYWFCYAMNDWRSTFSGVNDHESDWEQITLFLTEPDGGGEPVLTWVAFSSHDEVGDDLRRRVDDPDLTLIDGTHPVVFVGAGSHSGAYLPGDYLVSVAPPSLQRWVNAWYGFWGFLLPWTRDHEPRGFGIPFIDYRRGDGVAVGPGTGLDWTPVLIDDDTPWVVAYRGLWGYDTRDPLGGERAPAGPRYERDGSVRPSWERPVSWAGLDKQPPTAAAQREALTLRASELGIELAAAEQQLLVNIEHLRAVHEGARAARAHGTADPGPLSEAQAAVDASRSRVGLLRTERDAVAATLTSPLPPDSAHAHLRHRSLPDVDPARPPNWALRAWSTVSVSVLLLGAAAVIFFDYDNRFHGLVWLALVMVGIEAALNGRIKGFLATVFTLLLIVGVGWLVLDNSRVGIALLLVIQAVALLSSNLTNWLRSR